MTEAELISTVKGLIKDFRESGSRKYLIVCNVAFKVDFGHSLDNPPTISLLNTSLHSEGMEVYWRGKN